MLFYTKIGFYAAIFDFWNTILALRTKKYSRKLNPFGTVGFYTAQLTKIPAHNPLIKPGQEAASNARKPNSEKLLR